MKKKKNEKLKITLNILIGIILICIIFAIQDRRIDFNKEITDFQSGINENIEFCKEKNINSTNPNIDTYFNCVQTFTQVRQLAISSANTVNINGLGSMILILLTIIIGLMYLK